MKTNLKIRNQLLVFLLGLFFASCLTNVEETEVEEPDACASFSFATNVKPIIDANCIQCHSSGGNSPNLTTYNNISSSATSVKDAVSSRRMPQNGSLTNEEIEAIVCWVESGALDN